MVKQSKYKQPQNMSSEEEEKKERFHTQQQQQQQQYQQYLQQQQQQQQQQNDNYDQYPSNPNRGRAYFSIPFKLFDHVDCLDSHNHWLNGEIIAIKHNKVKIHFTGWDSKYDVWLDAMSNNILVQWRPGMRFLMNHRIDVLDTEGKFLEARIIDISQTQIRVHYKNYSTDWDQWINKSSKRIAQIGRFSNAYGAARFNSSSSAKKQTNDKVLKAVLSAKQQDNTQQQYYQKFNDDQQLSEQQKLQIKKLIAKYREEQQKFRRILSQKQMKIIKTQSDGNCLFRAVADQIYGDQQLHNLVRQRCMDYIAVQKEFFKQYVVGGDANFDIYVQTKRKDGIWGDDIEIQAISEIYNRPVEIYAYSDKPMRTFHESNDPTVLAIKISYHGQAHYNSIVPLNPQEQQEMYQILQDIEPGRIEQQAIKISRLRLARKRAMQRKKQLEQKKQISQQQPKQQQQQQEKIEQSNKKVQQSDEVVQKSRQIFEAQGVRDMQAVLAQSMQDAKKVQQCTKLLNPNSLERVQQAIKNSMKDINPEFSQIIDNQHQLLSSVMQNSKQDAENAQLQQAIKQSLMMDPQQMMMQNVTQQNLDDSIKQVMKQGFSLQRAMEAYSMMGGNADLMLQYLYGLLQFS